MTGFPDPGYDLLGALETLLQGINMQQCIVDAGAARYAAKGFVPLNATDIPIILATAPGLDISTVPAKYAPTLIAPPIPAALPPYPTGLPRFPDSNPEPRTGWSEFQVAYGYGP